MANITINIKNCGCGGSTSGGTTTPTTPPIDDGWADPSSTSGPPDGFFEPTSGLDDRQCKMAVWLYDWLEANLTFYGTTTTGAVALGVIRNLTTVGNVLPGLAQALFTVIAVIIGLLNGPGLTDIAIAFIAWGVAGALIASLAGAQTGLITQPLIQDALPKIEAYKSEIICQLSRATDALSAYLTFQTTIEGISDLTFEQKGLAKGFMFRGFFNMLFYTSDYWPTFDEDYLAGITTTCCGGYVSDDPVEANSMQHCQASWYIVEQLAAAMMAVYDTAGWWGNANPFDDDRPDIYAWLETNLATPPKIKERAYNYQTYLNAITEFTYTEFFLWLPSHASDMTEFYDFAQYLYTNADTLTAALLTATDTTEAYNALQPLRDWITTNITDSDAQTWMLAALDALIKPRIDGDGLLDLLFRQDPDLAYYATDKCTSGSDAGYLTAIDSVTPASTATITDEAYLIGASDDLGMYIKDSGDNTVSVVEGDFGQVYENAIKLEIRVQSDTLASAKRRINYVKFYVKEAVEDDWTDLGLTTFEGSDLDNGAWTIRGVTFNSLNIRYVKMYFVRRYNAFGKKRVVMV